MEGAFRTVLHVTLTIVVDILHMSTAEFVYHVRIWLCSFGRLLVNETCSITSVRFVSNISCQFLDVHTPSVVERFCELVKQHGSSIMVLPGIAKLVSAKLRLVGSLEDCNTCRDLEPWCDNHHHSTCLQPVFVVTHASPSFCNNFPTMPPSTKTSQPIVGNLKDFFEAFCDMVVVNL